VSTHTQKVLPSPFPELLKRQGDNALTGYLKHNHRGVRNFTDLYYNWDPRAGAPTNLVRVPGRKDTLEGSNKRSNPNLGETVILTQGRTASPLGLSDINGTEIYLKVMRVDRRLASTSLY